MEQLSNQFSTRLNLSDTPTLNRPPNAIRGHYINAVKFLCKTLNNEFSSAKMPLSDIVVSLSINTTYEFMELVREGKTYNEAYYQSANNFLDRLRSTLANNININPDRVVYSSKEMVDVREAVETIGKHMIAELATGERDLVPKLVNFTSSHSKSLVQQFRQGIPLNEALTQLKSNPAARAKASEITELQANKDELIMKASRLARIVGKLPILEKGTRSKTAFYIKNAAQELARTSEKLPNLYIPSDPASRKTYYCISEMVNRFADSVDKLEMHFNRHLNQYGLKDRLDPHFDRQKQAKNIYDMTKHINKFLINKLPAMNASDKKKKATNENIGFYRPISDGPYEPPLRLELAVDKMK